MQRSLVVIVALALPVAASAQQATVRATVRATDSTPIVGVQARFPELARTVMTDTSGVFTTSDVPRGRWLLQLRRLGFAPLDTTLDVGTSTAAYAYAYAFVLQRSAQPLDTTTVTARAATAIPYAATLPEFEARRAHATGRFLTREQLRKEDERAFADVLRSYVPGLLLEVAFDGVHAYNPSQQPAGALLGNRGRKCYVQVVVDGSSIYEMGRSRVQDDMRPPPDLSGFLTNSLDGLEYYSGPSRTPPEFRGTGAICGTLVLWSRRR